MSPFVTIITIACVIGISCGQMLFKKAAMSLPIAAQWQDWVLNPWLVSALALYGVTTLVWIWVLRHAPLHLAYPFMGLAFVIVPLLGWIFLREPVKSPTIIGGVLILAGITVCSRGS